jgi:hypothetical protein
MNLAETSQLLALIARYDNRKADDATVVAWHAVLGDLDVADCRAAVVAHIGTADAYLMPVHIRRGVAEIERERHRVEREAREAAQKEIEAADPTRHDRSAAVRALIDQLRTELPEGDPDSLRHSTREWRRAREGRERQLRAVPNEHYDPSALARLADSPEQAS